MGHRPRTDVLSRRDRHISKELEMATTNNTMGNVISSEKVEGTSVYNLAGNKLGSVDDLMIDKISGQVRYAVMEFGGFLGIDTDRYPIPWKMLKYDTELGGYVVPIDKTMLEKAPKYSSDRIPTYDVEYGQRLNGYYGVEW
jgi:sporulation protein YlmC with PRC-barrel domain